MIEGFWELKNIRLHFYKSGNSGPHVLLFHGLGNASQVWFPFIEAMSNRFQCFAVDWPGCGRSSSGIYTYDDVFYIDIIKQVLERINSPEIILAGHSMGGQWVSLYPAITDIRIKQIWLFAPSGIENYNATERKIVLEGLRWGHYTLSPFEMLFQALQKSVWNNPALTNQYISIFRSMYEDGNPAHFRDMILKSVRAMLYNPTLEQLKTTVLPTRIFFGNWDALIPNPLFKHDSVYTMLKEIKDVNKKISAYIFPETGHFIHIERVKELSNFLKSEEILSDFSV